jgi:uncharacterized protein YegP (UPF0339 family)
MAGVTKAAKAAAAKKAAAVRREVVLSRTQHASKESLTFTVYSLTIDGKKEWGWNLRSANGEIIAQGESYKNYKGVTNAVSLVQARAADADVFVREDFKPSPDVD